MSRSFRAPWYVDGWEGSRRKRFYKRYANRVIRRTESEIADGKAYRKFFDNYSICDYKWLYDPNPHVFWMGGKQYVIEPDPIWKVNRK